MSLEQLILSISVFFITPYFKKELHNITIFSEHIYVKALINQRLDQNSFRNVGIRGLCNIKINAAIITIVLNLV